MRFYLFFSVYQCNRAPPPRVKWMLPKIAPPVQRELVLAEPEDNKAVVLFQSGDVLLFAKIAI